MLRIVQAPLRDLVFSEERGRLGKGADGSSKNGNQKNHYKGMTSGPTIHGRSQVVVIVDG